MKKSINILTQRYKENLRNLINNSGLPIANVYFVTKLTMQQLENTYYGILNDELAASDQQEEVVNEEETTDEQQQDDEETVAAV